MKQLHNEVYIVNRLGAYFAVPTKKGKIVFEYNKPVLINYEQEPLFVAELLQNPSLGLCTVEEAEKLLAPVTPVVEAKEQEEVENPESVTDKLSEEK